MIKKKVDYEIKGDSKIDSQKVIIFTIVFTVFFVFFSIFTVEYFDISYIWVLIITFCTSVPGILLATLVWEMQKRAGQKKYVLKENEIIIYDRDTSPGQVSGLFEFKRHISLKEIASIKYYPLLEQPLKSVESNTYYRYEDEFQPYFLTSISTHRKENDEVYLVKLNNQQNDDSNRKITNYIAFPKHIIDHYLDNDLIPDAIISK